MGLGDRVSNAAEDMKGEAKEGFGKATGDSQMEAEGKTDQAKADIKDKFEDAKDWVTDKFNDVADGVKGDDK